uniref:CBS domain-containing protein n=1 Tax=Caenorhabditis tropicalis TaxID=1561998 RepID=A0A1I7TRV4_9PELO
MPFPASDTSSFSPIQTPMQLRIFGMLTEHDLLTTVPRCFPTRDDADTVSYFLRKDNFNLMLANNSSAVRNFGEINLKGTMTGKDFFEKMKRYCAENTIIPGYIPP